MPRVHALADSLLGLQCQYALYSSILVKESGGNKTIKMQTHMMTLSMNFSLLWKVLVVVSLFLVLYPAHK